jgi:hypothetical protein
MAGQVASAGAGGERDCRNRPGRPQADDETWARLRHLRVRREQLIVDAVAQIQQIRALLECVWPAGLDAANYPFRSKTWAAPMTVIVDRDGGDLVRTRRLGIARFERAARREIGNRGGRKPSLRIVRALFTALSDPAGVAPTGAARSNACSCCSRTGGKTNESWPTPSNA